MLKKNKGNSELLLIWADEFELVSNERKIAEKFIQKFADSSFEEVYFMTFTNNMVFFINSLQLWPIKLSENSSFPNETVAPDLWADFRKRTFRR